MEFIVKVQITYTAVYMERINMPVENFGSSKDENIYN